MEKKRGGSTPSGSGRVDDWNRARVVTLGGREGVTICGREAERWVLDEPDGGGGGALGIQERSGHPSSEKAVSARIRRLIGRMYLGKSERKDTLRVRRELARRKPSKSRQGIDVTSLPTLSK